MNYLGSPYNLSTVVTEIYKQQAHNAGVNNIQYGLDEAVAMATQGEDFKLADTVVRMSGHLHDAYKRGGGFYALAFCVGWQKLRFVNPSTVVPQATPQDWDAMIGREIALRARPSVTTLEQIGGTGLLEVQGVNAGYVEGYQQLCVDNPTMTPFAGFTGLATLHAHDLLHFASQRQR